MRLYYTEDSNGERVLMDKDNPDVVRGGPVSGVDAVIHNPITGTIVRSKEPAEVLEDRKANQ